MVKLVRVHFDDDSFIDCTPDHKFKIFKSKNGYIEEHEWDVEAKDLKPKQQVRAVRFEKSKTGRIYVSTRRDITILQARLAMEGSIGRKLFVDERVHHKDRNQGNDLLENLVLTTKQAHIKDYHPEIAERMKTNNPAKFMTKEWKTNISKSVKGKKRTIEQRLNYRNSKLGEKNPRYKINGDHRWGHASRIKEIDVNHKISWVEELEQRDDVYCMEVPDIHWFYANKVLVHNCAFCASKKIHTRNVRYRKVDSVIAELDVLVNQYDVRLVNFMDDTFILNKPRVYEICTEIRKYWNEVLNWFFLTRTDCVDYDLFCEMKRSGALSVTFGFETGSNKMLKVLNKGATVQQSYQAIKVTKDAGLKIRGQLMVGIPTETDEDVEQTATFIKNSPEVDTFGLHLFQPLPGSDIWDNPEQFGIEVDPDSDFSTFHTIGRPGEEIADKVVLERFNYLKDIIGNRNADRFTE
jgi:radical SAM superfamily enzyme